MSIVLHGECGREYPDGTFLPPSDVCTCQLWHQLALAREGLEKLSKGNRSPGVLEIAQQTLAKLSETIK